MRALALIVLGLVASGCTHSIHMVNFSDFRPYPRANERQVTASAEQFTILGFADGSKYVNVAYQELLNKCPQGQLTGIQTKFYTSHGFFSWTDKVSMTGVCAPASAAD